MARFALASFLLPTLLAAQGMGGGKVLPRESDLARQVDRPAPPLELVDVAAERGLTGRNVYGGVDAKRAILEMTGNGVGLVDVDNDGRLDVILVNGTRFGEDDPPGARLYRNQGGGRFEEQADSGLTRRGWGHGVCAGDYDRDGFTDLLVTYHGHNALYRNAGGERFEETTAAAGLPTTGQDWGVGCAFLDHDLDGDLDLFVANYVSFDRDATPAEASCNWRGLDVFCGPRGFPSGRNWLFENQGDGTFEDVSRESGVLLDGELHYGLGVVASDFDDDGDPDVYVACDSTPSLFYENQGDGTFQDVSVGAGVAYGAEGQEEGSMGAAAADFDNDGRLDLAVSNFIDETPTLYRNEGDLFFTDETYRAGLGVETGRVGWGILPVDFDQDGWRDLLIVNGHIYPELAGAGKTEQFAQPKLAFWNLRNGAFREVSGGWGEALNAGQVSRGAAAGDLDGDGRLEVVVSNLNGEPELLTPRGPTGASALIDLGAAIGGRVTLEAGGLTQIDEVRSGGSYASQNDFRLHFGLGEADRVESLTVRWPDGQTETFKNLPANATIRIRPGDRPQAKPFLSLE